MTIKSFFKWTLPHFQEMHNYNIYSFVNHKENRQDINNLISKLDKDVEFLIFKKVREIQDIETVSVYDN